jgi:hypothetical protein
LLEDGSTRLSDPDGAFLFRRPRPGVLLIAISGRDVGQFGEIPFEEMEAEAARFGPLAIYLDTSGAEVAGAEVVTRWTGWLRQLPVWVRSLDILHGGETTGLNVAIAAHLARRPGRLTAHDDRERFVRAVRQAAPSFSGPDVPPPPPLPAVRREHHGDSDVFRAGTATLTVRSLGPARVLVTIGGYDRGEFGGTPFDEIHRRTDARPGLQLLLDLREARGAAAHVAEAWTQWFATHRRAMSSVDVLVDSQSVHVAVNFAQHLSGTGDLIRIHRDATRFEEAMARS